MSVEKGKKVVLSIAETCEVMGCSRPMVMSYIHRQDNPLPCIKSNRKYMVPSAALEQWVLEEAQRNSGALALARLR